VPGAPTDVAATSGDDAASTVSWVAPADDGGSPITGYVVTPYIGTDAADPVAVDDPTATAHTVTGLTNGTAYTFTVAAVNAAGEGPESEPSEPATPMGPDIEPIPEPAVFAPIDPGRYWDTRDEPTIDELFSNTGRLADEATFRVQLTGRPGIPDGSTGVVANLTVIAPDGPGYATLYPCADTVPFVSTVNYQAGEVLANNVAVPLDDDGGVCVFTLRGADFALDVNGFVGPDAPQVGITPARYLDTRTGSGDVTFDGTGQGDGQVPAGGVVHVQIAGRGDVPDDAQAAIVNVTVVNPVEPGYVTLYPCTADVPTASTVNYFPGDVVPNGAVVDLSDDGELCIFTLAATDVLLDVTGFVPAGAEGITPMAPARLFDSRPGEPLVDGDAVGPRLAAGEWVEVQVTGRADIPDTATAAFFNVAVVFPDGPGFVTLAPAEGTEAPTTSNLNHVAGGGVRANNAFTRLSDDGTVWIFTLSGADIVLDVTGYTE